MQFTFAEVNIISFAGRGDEYVQLFSFPVLKMPADPLSAECPSFELI